MLTIRIDGEVLETDLGAARTLNDLIDVVQATIDPETIITDIQLDEQELTESDWRSPLSAQAGKTLDFLTGSRESYLADRFADSPVLLEYIINRFAHVRGCFQDGTKEEGNKALSSAVDDLKAFIEWYNSLLFISPEVDDTQRADYLHHIETLTKVCEQLLQQHLYQSWWALGETLENKLEPELKNLLERVSSLSSIGQSV